MMVEGGVQSWKRICAPMVRYSKLPFRLLVRKYGVDMCFTPMIVAKSFVESPSSRLREFCTSTDDQSLIVQFASNDPAELGLAAEYVYKYSNGIDLNCGCPQRDIKKSVTIPIFANGDAKSLKLAQEIVDKTNVDGVMSARGILHNPALFMGNESTPISCIRDWVTIAICRGTLFTTFHHHLMFMLDSFLNKSEKRIFNRLTCVPAVIDYLDANVFCYYD